MSSRLRSVQRELVSPKGPQKAGINFYNALVFQSEKILEGGQNLWTKNLSLLKISKVGISHFAEVSEQCRPEFVLE